MGVQRRPTAAPIFQLMVDMGKVIDVGFENHVIPFPNDLDNTDGVVKEVV
jgi:hypothetical protein